MFVLNVKLCIIYALIAEAFGGLNLVFLICFFLLKKPALIFISPVASLTLGIIHRKLFSLKNSEVRSATVFCDKTVHIATTVKAGYGIR